MSKEDDSKLRPEAATRFDQKHITILVICFWSDILHLFGHVQSFLCQGKVREF